MGPLYAHGPTSLRPHPAGWASALRRRENHASGPPRSCRYKSRFPTKPTEGDQREGATLDNHERGWETKPGRIDMPLPQWKGRYGGDPHRLPRVVQKLMGRHKLTAEEKAELLWRFYELDVESRASQRKRLGVIAAMCLTLVAATLWVCLHPPQWLFDSVAGLIQHVKS